MQIRSIKSKNSSEKPKKSKATVAQVEEAQKKLDTANESQETIGEFVRYEEKDSAFRQRHQRVPKMQLQAECETAAKAADMQPSNRMKPTRDFEIETKAKLGE